MSCYALLRKLSIAAGLLSIVTVSKAASAQNVDVRALQSNPTVQAAISACTLDRERLCAGVIPGGGRIVRCLAARPDALSPPCFTAMQKVSAALSSAGIALPVPPAAK